MRSSGPIGSQSNPRIVRFVGRGARDQPDDVDWGWVGNATVKMVEFDVSILTKLHVVNGNVTERKFHDLSGEVLTLDVSTNSHADSGECGQTECVLHYYNPLQRS